MKMRTFLTFALEKREVNGYLPKFNYLGYKCFQKKKSKNKSPKKKRINSQKESVMIRETRKKLEMDLRPAQKRSPRIEEKAEINLGGFIILLEHDIRVIFLSNQLPR